MAISIKKISGIIRNSVKKVNMVGSDSFTKSLLHFNSSNASTTFTDEIGKTWTPRGNAQLATADYAYATASLLLDGTGDSIDTPNSADFDFGTGDFTVECWVKRNGVFSYPGIFSTEATDYAGFDIDLGAEGTTPRMISNWSGSPFIDIISSSALTDLTWTHIALVRYGNTITLYLGGVSKGTVNCTGWTCNSAGIGLAVGRTTVSDNANYGFGGWIDEFRLSKGIARYTGAFTPPNAEYRITGVKKISGVSNV